MKKRYFIHMAYNGTRYHGWQIQPNAISVQQVLEEKLSTFLREEIKVIGCGRTDTGVHASDFYAHFECEKELETQQVVYKLNNVLPTDVAVFDVFEVGEEDHARFTALARTYQYHLHNFKDPFKTETSYFIKGKLDVEAMNKAGEIMTQYTDFTSLSKTGTDVKTNNCKVEYAHWKEEGNTYIFEVKADRFLRNMVRATVGTMLEIGQGKKDVESMHEVLKAKSRSSAGFSVPAHGLYLYRIDYPVETLKNQQR